MMNDVYKTTGITFSLLILVLISTQSQAYRGQEVELASMPHDTDINYKDVNLGWRSYSSPHLFAPDVWMEMLEIVSAITDHQPPLPQHRSLILCACLTGKEELILYYPGDEWLFNDIFKCTRCNRPCFGPEGDVLRPNRKIDVIYTPKMIAGERAMKERCKSEGARMESEQRQDKGE